MKTIVGDIVSDVAQLLGTYPFNLFLGFAILGITVSIMIKWFKFRT